MRDGCGRFVLVCDWFLPCVLQLCKAAVANRIVMAAWLSMRLVLGREPESKELCV